MNRTVLILLSLLFGAQARAGVLELAPTVIASVPSTGEVESKVFLTFETAALEAVPRIRISEAILTWRLSSLVPNRTEEFRVERIVEGWDRLGIAGGWRPESVEIDDSEWLLDANDYQRIGPVVRCDVTGVVGRWLTSESENLGLVLSSSALDATDLAETSNIRLIVRFRTMPR